MRTMLRHKLPIGAAICLILVVLFVALGRSKTKRTAQAAAPLPEVAVAPDREVDQKTGTIRLGGIFPNPGNVLRPGQYAKVRAVTRIKTAALLVPQRAVTELQGSYRVAVVDADNKIDIRPVKVGERVGAMLVVEEGLKPGEIVVVEGMQKVRPGAAVTPKQFVAAEE